MRFSRMGLLALGVVALVCAPATWADDPIQVPFRRTDTQHILVRAKINGKGPFNFIIDTGAPAMFVAKSVGQKLGLESKRGWATLDRLDIEGGVKLDKVKVRVETPFQLEGMNGMNLAGAELHGIIGYMVLARFRMEIDLSRDKMAWTPLKFDPPPPQGLGGNPGSAQAGLEMLGSIMKLLGVIAGRGAIPEPQARGFVGIQLGDKEQSLTVAAVYPKSPAAEAGIEVGDRIVEINGRSVASSDDVAARLGNITAGHNIRFTLRRGKVEKSITVQAGEGL